MLAPEAIEAGAEAVRQTTGDAEAVQSIHRAESQYVARAFLAAQDREALAGVAHRALLDLHRGAAVYVQARAVIDALLGPERTMTP
jgi:hypothetical protein